MVVVTDIWRVTNHRTEDVCSHCFLTANRPTNFYVGVASQKSEPTFLVQHLLANLTGSVINITQENCQNQREDEDDKESKNVRLLQKLILEGLVAQSYLPPASRSLTLYLNL